MCPLEYRNTSIERLSRESGTFPDRIESIVNRPYGPRGICVFGRAGLGKTRSIWLLVRKWHDRGIPVATFNLASADSSLSAQVSESFRRGEFVEWAEKIMSAKALFWDDFDKDQLTGRAEEAAFSMIESFVSARKPLLVTTQATGEQLAEKFKGERGSGILRRIREFCDGVNFQVGGTR